MASGACQLVDEVTAHAQSNRLEDAREIRPDGTYFPKNLCMYIYIYKPVTYIQKLNVNTKN